MTTPTPTRTPVSNHGHEHELEPQHGLPEPLPASERLLWQGSPDWRALALRAFHLRKIALYFALVLVIRGALLWTDGESAGAIAFDLLKLAPLPLFALGTLAALAWLSARATVYTITDRRVVMRVGIVLTLTYNLPLRTLRNADLQVAGDGIGDIALLLPEQDHIAWLHLWPHARPWHVKHPQPALRCLPDAQAVARVLAGAWSAATGVAPTVVAARRTGEAAVAASATPAAQGALATH
jgi:hypothetical protein